MIEQDVPLLVAELGGQALQLLVARRRQVELPRGDIVHFVVPSELLLPRSVGLSRRAVMPATSITAWAKSLRRLLRQIVADAAGDRAMLVGGR